MPNLLKRISINSQICHGKPCIRGHRIMVYLILELLAAGVSPEEIISDDYYPTITLEDVYACIEFANQFVKNDEIHFFEGLKAS